VHINTLQRKFAVTALVTTVLPRNLYISTVVPKVGFDYTDEVIGCFVSRLKDNTIPKVHFLPPCKS
jgi:hypothetical protein